MTRRQGLELAAVLVAIVLFAVGVMRKQEALVARAEDAFDGEIDAAAGSESARETRGAPEVGTPAALAAPSEAPRYIRPSGDSASLPFSRAVMVGDTIYLSGTLGLEPGTRTPADDPAIEARRAMDNFKASVEAAGASMDDLVSVRVFCSDAALYDTFNNVYRTYFTEGRFPARAFIITAPLLFGAHFEVTGIAVRRK